MYSKLTMRDLRHLLENDGAEKLVYFGQQAISRLACWRAYHLLTNGDGAFANEPEGLAEEIHAILLALDGFAAPNDLLLKVEGRYAGSLRMQDTALAEAYRQIMDYFFTTDKSSADLSERWNRLRDRINGKIFDDIVEGAQAEADAKDIAAVKGAIEEHTKTRDPATSQAFAAFSKAIEESTKPVAPPICSGRGNPWDAEDARARVVGAFPVTRKTNELTVQAGPQDRITYLVDPTTPSTITLLNEKTSLPPVQTCDTVDHDPAFLSAGVQVIPPRPGTRGSSPIPIDNDKLHPAPRVADLNQSIGSGLTYEQAVDILTYSRRRGLITEQQLAEMLPQLVKPTGHSLAWHQQRQAEISARINVFLEPLTQRAITLGDVLEHFRRDYENKEISRDQYECMCKSLTEWVNRYEAFHSACPTLSENEEKIAKLGTLADAASVGPLVTEAINDYLEAAAALIASAHTKCEVGNQSYAVRQLKFKAAKLAVYSVISSQPSPLAARTELLRALQEAAPEAPHPEHADWAGLIVEVQRQDLSRAAVNTLLNEAL